MKKIIYTLLIMLSAMHCINGMEKEKESTEYDMPGGRLFDQPIIKNNEQIISCERNKGVSVEKLSLPSEEKPSLESIKPLIKEHNPLANTQRSSETPITPRRATYKIIENVKKLVQLPAIDLIYTEKNVYFLGKNIHQQKTIFSQDLVTKEIAHPKKLPVHFLSYKKPYFFYQLQRDEKNVLNVSTLIQHASPLAIKHKSSVLSFGIIENTVFSGSTWPSIKKSTLPTSGRTINSEQFIDNAFLLACQNNGMIIAKINQENNARFWFWRRFNKIKDVQVTLYALFFEQKSIATITKKMVEKALDEAKEQYSLENENHTQNNTYSTNNITVITLATNVTITADEQSHANKKFPKAAISNNTALVVHTQRYNSDAKEDAFPIQNPAVSIAYKDKTDNWKPNQFSLSSWISKQKQKGKNYIRLPYLYEIKDIYITEHNKKPVALLISKVNEKYDVSNANYADGVYAIPLTGQEKYDLPEPLWHVDIEYKNTTEHYQKKSTIKNESWKPTKKIVASTFDYDNKRLFLITESILKKSTASEQNSDQQLITIDITKAMQDPQRLAKIDENKLKIRKDQLKEVHQELIRKRKKLNKAE